MLTRLKLAVALLVLCFSLFAHVSPASAWTWSSATHPAGSIQYGGGGIYRYHGIYYVPGVAHVEQQLGQHMIESAATGSGFFGHTAHTTWAGTFQQADFADVATGSDPIPPDVRVSQGWDKAPIDTYASSTIPAGSWACQSGFSPQTTAASGYRCGQMIYNCTATDNLCTFGNASGLVGNGDSGGLVWIYSAHGVMLMGWLHSGYLSGPWQYAADGSFQAGQFIPIWAYAHYSWKTSESWQGGPGISPFPAGNDGTGCFVTITGCQKV